MKKQFVLEAHQLDENGRPAGGITQGLGIRIDWQDGLLSVDGAFVEGVIEAAIGRLEFYNSTEFCCPENGLAIKHLEEALNWLQARTADRVERGVEGTHGL
jgi:hypothetical protein